MKTFLTVLITVIVIGAIGGAYYLGANNADNQTVVIPTAVPTQPLVGNDRDEHGCIGSAGYSWCEEKQKCLRIWEEPCIASPSGKVTSSPTIDETEAIKTAIKTALVAKHGDTAKNLNVSISKIEGDYAQGGASEPGVGGGMWLAAKVNSTWKLVWDGNGQISCSDLTLYPDFPNTMISECFNDATLKMIQR